MLSKYRGPDIVDDDLTLKWPNCQIRVTLLKEYNSINNETLSVVDIVGDSYEFIHSDQAS